MWLRDLNAPSPYALLTIILHVHVYMPYCSGHFSQGLISGRQFYISGQQVPVT